MLGAVCRSVGLFKILRWHTVPVATALKVGGKVPTVPFAMIGQLMMNNERFPVTCVVGLQRAEDCSVAVQCGGVRGDARPLWSGKSLDSGSPSMDAKSDHL